uniref:CHK domain-containing protein n=1 Tax=Angiostrongylus cantonensis TaxID=6313 RepID=A0A0K0DGV2_ANGCA
MNVFGRVDCVSVSPFQDFLLCGYTSSGDGAGDELLLHPTSFQLLPILTQLVIQHFTTEVAKEKNMENEFSNPEMKATIELHQKRCHNTEVTVYSHLIRLLEGKFPLPKIFFMKKFSENNPLKGYIIMEYLDNLKTVHIYENIATESLKQDIQILRAIAVLEAMSLDFSLKERKEFLDKPFTGIYEAVFNNETLGILMEILRTFRGDHPSEKFDRLKKALPHLVDFEWADRLPEEIGMRPVLCHGDLWSMNILWRTKKDNLKIAALIDFQRIAAILTDWSDTNFLTLERWKAWWAKALESIPYMMQGTSGYYPTRAREEHVIFHSSGSCPPVTIHAHYLAGQPYFRQLGVQNGVCEIRSLTTAASDPFPYLRDM